MESSKVLALYCLGIICLQITVDGSKILLFPNDVGYNSRVMNMLKLGRMLTNAKHQVTCVISDKMREEAMFKLAEGENADLSFNVVSYKTPPVEMRTDNEDLSDLMLNLDMPQLYVIVGAMFFNTLENTLKDKTIVKLAKEDFDLIITDELVFFPRIISANRSIPIILYSNFGTLTFDSDIIPRYSLAFVNGCFNRFSDVMSFFQRLENVWEYLRVKLVLSDAYSAAKVLCRSYGYGKSCDNIREIHKTVNLVLMNRNDVIHYPAPYMPHIVSTEGFFLEKPKPLDAYYKDILKGSETHGIIVVSFGSLFRRLGRKYRTIFAKAFSRMPQTVIWSYEGETPEGLGENTIVNKWIPQTDLLSSPAVKLFVTQCGASSLFEALNNGLPVVGVPFIGDQEYNCLKLAKRVKSAKIVKLNTITSEQLQNAMEEVINNETYRTNARKAATMYHDQLIDPRNKTLYWIEYVIRHKGAQHLRSAGENQLNFFQYYLLDIAGSVVIVIIIALTSVTVIVKALLKCLVNATKLKKA
ncbi:unnamed protein product [Owenia fusiformis]|uniref:UDP-glucuronosyltransferase n=1 Tax=Owenia fusiformis TaxID=6347 RepID=A0A8J1TW66_OWEFU|nr:unnamed protein product [Owenia fusiformis]